MRVVVKLAAIIMLIIMGIGVYVCGLLALDRAIMWMAGL